MHQLLFGHKEFVSKSDWEKLPTFGEAKIGELARWTNTGDAVMRLTETSVQFYAVVEDVDVENYRSQGWRRWRGRRTLLQRFAERLSSLVRPGWLKAPRARA